MQGVWFQSPPANPGAPPDIAELSFEGFSQSDLGRSVQRDLETYIPPRLFGPRRWHQIPDTGAAIEHSDTPRPTSSHRERISFALRDLLSREGDFSFVIFEDSLTKKFVQFGMGEGENAFFLDLPDHNLPTPREMARARAFFREYGVAPAPMSGGLEGHLTFRMSFGDTEVERAAEITLRAFKEIYRAPADFELTISPTGH